MEGIFKKYNDTMFGSTWKNISFESPEKFGLIQLFIGGVLIAQTNYVTYASITGTIVPIFFLNVIEIPFLKYNKIELKVGGETIFNERDLYFEVGNKAPLNEVDLLLEYYDKDITTDMLDQRHRNILKFLDNSQCNLMYVPHLTYHTMVVKFKKQLSELVYRDDLEYIEKFS